MLSFQSYRLKNALILVLLCELSISSKMNFFFSLCIDICLHLPIRHCQRACWFPTFYYSSIFSKDVFIESQRRLFTISCFPYFGTQSNFWSLIIFKDWNMLTLTENILLLKCLLGMAARPWSNDDASSNWANVAFWGFCSN